MDTVLVESNNVEKFDYSFVGGNRLVHNRSVKGQSSKTKVYSFEPYAQELFDLYTHKDSPREIKKDLELGDNIKIRDIKSVNDGIISMELETGVIVEVHASKEKKFINLLGYNSHHEFCEALSDREAIRAFLSNDFSVHVTEVEPPKASLWKAYVVKIHEEFFGQITNPSKAYVAKVLDANKGGYFVDVQGVEAFMPGSLSAPNKLVNFKDLIGEEVIVMIEDFIKDMNSFIVSHKKYIEHVLPTKIKELDLKKRYTGKITGTSKYGIFVEFEKIFTGLLHVSKMKEETITEFKNRKFQAGDDIDFFINEITKDNRIILTEEDPEEKLKKIEEFAEKHKDSVIDAKVAAVMKFGVIVNAEDLSGLIPNKEFRKKKISTRDLSQGEAIEVVFFEHKDGKITFNLPE